jgi:hypothetical protein
MQFDLGGAVRLRLETDDPELTAAVTRQMDPYPAAADQADGAPLVTIRLDQAGPMQELQHRAGDGLVTGWDGTTLHAVAGTRRASVPDAYRNEPAAITFERGFPVGRHFRQVVRTALQLRALAGSTVAVHAAAVDTDDGAILVAGWSESGKTETALALAEDGRRFLSDKWTLVTSGEPSAIGFPINVGVRRWVLRYLPRLRAALPRRAQLQVAVAGAAAVVSAPVRGLRASGGGGMLAASVERAAALADRAALAPSELARAYGHPPILQPRPVKLLVALRSVPGDAVRAHEPNVDDLATRLAVTASAERQTYWAYRDRAAYASAVPDDVRTEVIAAEISLLRALLGQVPSVEVEAPFPIDPRRVVAAVEPWLLGR